MSKLWGGRFDKATDTLLERFNASIGFDWRLYAADIAGSIAYARSIRDVGILTDAELDAIVRGLEQVRAEFDAGTFVALPSDEDIHTAVERRLGEIIGEAAGKLHTGRSRNDQIATDVRLYLLYRIPVLREHVRALQRAIVDKAEAHLDVMMPGYTHLQPAQPILFSHWLMSFFWMLQRDLERLDDLTRRVSVMPLGSAALAGNTFGIDRDALAADLGFARISENSLDAVSDRDFIAEMLFWAALLQTHLSRLAEDLILYATAEFGFVELDDAYSTGSSIMPQKKNPDSLELARGKTGRVVGNLIALLTTLKGLPSSYDKDLQEDKEPLFDMLDTLELELPIVAGVIRTLRIHPERMASALRDDLLATELADYLVRQGLPFRQGHHIVGQAVRLAGERGCGLRDLTVDDYRTLSPYFGDDVHDVLDFRRAIEQRSVSGGTATVAVKAQIDKAKSLLGG
ncbi:MAG TPA: argininosuccinate lyase [Anaerolineae bacterium]|nr:argininosuccinate lyase [Anaerolineae bacterium]HQK13658.1 argininosuccinate lyase [Anaerolineae bacterium]